MSTQVLYLSQIRTVLRNTDIESIDSLGGQFNDVLMINKAWVFRFPRYREGVARLLAETRLLEALRGRLPLPIPDPVYQVFEPPVPGLAFMGYHLLPGQPFTRSALEMVDSEAVRDDLSSQLAGFLRSLHAIPLADVEPLVPGDLQTADGRTEWEQMYSQVREKLFDSMRPDARRQVAEHFERYLDDSSLHRFIPCLRHGDFGGSNILWVPAQGRASGVIDFSFCALGDPAADLASISTLGEDFFNRLAPRYEPDETRRAPLLARARFYRGTFALKEALDGIRDHDKDAYLRGMEGYV